MQHFSPSRPLAASAMPSSAPSRSLRAMYMRGGRSKGLFLHEADLPRRGELRDRLLLRLCGSPDPQALHADGMGSGLQGATKLVIAGPSTQAGFDLEFMLGVVSPEGTGIDWSGNCAELCAAVAPFAIHEGLIKPVDGIARVRLWQRSLEQRIDALVPVQAGQVLEAGQFREDGVPFHAAEIRLEFHQPEVREGAAPLLPSGRPSDDLPVPGLGKLRVTMINAGQPTVFVRADVLDLTGKELPLGFKRAQAKVKLLEAIRSQAALVMGLAPAGARSPARTAEVPAIAWVAKPASYRSSGGDEISAEQCDILVRSLNMGKLESSCSGAGAIALAAAAALPGSVVNEITRTLPGVATRIGHCSGTLAVGAEVSNPQGVWRLDVAVVSRSARRLMSGLVHWPNDVAGC